jgi:Mlc titration factor MtfA (ptsG expression regulator)
MSRLAKFSPRDRAKLSRHAELLRAPFPIDWLEALQRNVWIYGRLTPSERGRLQDDLKILIPDMRWEGCGGLTVTDEIKVTIAAQACILLLGMEHDHFSHVSSILVYPSGFSIPERQVSAAGIVAENVGALGEAWYRGPVVVAWDEALAGGRDPENRGNVVYHEFAHQLDFQGEWPNRKLPEHRQRWREVMEQEYERLVEATERGNPTLLDPYGATSPAEFFAVVTECFFREPVRMRNRHPGLFQVFRDFYGQDPSRWFDSLEF